jgi:hypothetical protein
MKSPTTAGSRSALALLERAYQKLTANGPQGWIKGSYAQTADGTKLHDGSDPSACRWCALGLLEFAAGRAFTRGVANNPMTEARLLLAASTPGFALAPFNDDPRTSFADIVEVYERAIRLAE